MATYVELQTDSFREILGDLGTFDESGKSRFDFDNVRRPYRGIEIKDDTYAIIKVIRSNGREIPLTDAGSRVSASSFSRVKDKNGNAIAPPAGTTFNYSNFIAQTIVEAREEKSQVVETFGEPYIFAVITGRHPQSENVGAKLLNDLLRGNDIPQ